MTEVRTSPVIAKRVDDIDEAKDAGSFEFFVAGDNEPAGVIYLCPCGCGGGKGVGLQASRKPVLELGRQHGEADADTKRPLGWTLARFSKEWRLGELLNGQDTMQLSDTVRSSEVKERLHSHFTGV
jgi:hypothetical protein